MRSVDHHEVVRSEQRHALQHRADSSRRALVQTLAAFEAPLQRVNRFQQRLSMLRPLLPAFAFIFAALTVLRLVLRLLRDGPPQRAAQRALPGGASRGSPRSPWLFRVQQLVNAVRLGMQVYALARATMLLATAPAQPRTLSTATPIARSKLGPANPDVSRWENEGGGAGHPAAINTSTAPRSSLSRPEPPR